MMANAWNAVLNYVDYILEREKVVSSFKRQCNTPNLRIPFRINWIAVLTVTTSILLCQFAESVAERQASSSHGEKYYNRRCLDQGPSNLRRSLQVPDISLLHPTPSPVEDSAVASQDILSRLEAAVVLRGNLVTALGRVLLLCLNDDARVPFELVHDAVRNHRIAAYDLLPILPILRNKLPKQQLYKLLQMLERLDNRFVSEYASLCINIFPDISVLLERAQLPDTLLNVDPETIEALSRDKRGSLLNLTKDVDSLLRAARKDVRIVDLRLVSAILANYPGFDLTDPEVHGAIEFVAQRMKERSRMEDPLFRNIEPHLESATDFLRTVLERLEVDESSSGVTREAISLLLQNLGAESYPGRKDDPRRLLTIASNFYPINVTAVARYLADRLDESDFRDLDIGFFETGDQALLQTLSRLRRKPKLQPLRKPLSLLMTFVAQKLAYESNFVSIIPISPYEVNDYLNSFDSPCLQRNASEMTILRSHLSEDLPWTYAFGDKRASDDPRELMLLSLINLRNVPISKSQAITIDNFIYKNRADDLINKRNLFYDSGVIFQREDSTDVEVDLFSLLMRVSNAFRSEKFAPMLNFLAKPNIFDVLSYKFNKFEHETPRSLFLAMLKEALRLPSVKSDEFLSRALQNACNYLEEPLLINLYTSEELQLLLRQLPDIENDPRYLPLKILFKKKKLFTYLSPSFNLAGMYEPMERLLLILQTLSLKVTEPSLSKALSFALDNLDGPPLKVKTFDRVDLVYLVQQLLSRNNILQNDILKSPVYTNVGDWNISISGTPENVLARVLSYPVKFIASNGHLANLVKQALNILEEGDLIDIEILKRETLDAMLEYLPDNTYAKPVILLLKKANLMTLVPKLNLATLEKASPSDALIMLLRSLTESSMIREEKLLLRRIRAVLNFFDGNSPPRQTPIYAYLVQSLQDSSNIIYKPLLQEVNKLQNVTVSSDERQAWLNNYLKKIIIKNETKELVEAALMALKEIGYDENAETLASKARISEALSFLPVDSFAKPVRKLLTPEWTYSILPEELKNLDFLEKEQLLLAILHHVKHRADVADNLALIKVISDVELKLDGWKMKVELLKSAIAAAKAAIYEPMRSLLTAARLNKIRAIVPSGESVKISLLKLLHNLLEHPVIKQNNKVFEMLSVVRQDVLAFGVDLDLLTVLDDVGVAYTSELAPVRLFLYKRDFNEKFARRVFAVADPVERYRILLDILWKQHQVNNDTQFHDALSVLKTIKPVDGESKRTSISDLNDLVNSISHHVRRQFKSLNQLFNVHYLSRFIADNEIVQSEKPLTVLLSKIASLPEVRTNRIAARELKKLRSQIEQLGDRPIVTGYQLRPLLLELGHVQQINVDYLSSILNPEVLSYLNPEEFFDLSDDNTEVLSTIVNYLLHAETMYVDYDMRKHLQSLKRALALTRGPVDRMFSKGYLSKEDWRKILVLIPPRKEFTPIKMFLQSKEIDKYIPKDTNWKLFSTPVKKLLHLLSLIEISDIENKSIYRSMNELWDNLEKRFNFVTEQDVRSMHRVLTSLKLKYDLALLKIFLNHDNLVKYLPSDFKYSKYGSPIDGLAAVLDNFLQTPSFRQRNTLYKTMTFVRDAIRKKTGKARRRLTTETYYKRLAKEDLEFISYISVPKLREFLKPENLLNLLPQIFTFDNRPTFKTKALHLLRQLLQLNTDVHADLEELAREVETYPDVPDITREDLAPLLNILPVEGIPHVELIKKYLKRPLTLIKLFPGNFNIKQAPKMALQDVLTLLSATLGSLKNDQLKTALNALTSEFAKISSNLIPQEALVDSNDIRSIIEEIPFKRHKQIEPLKTKMTVANVVSSLPMNFQLTNYKTKKLRVLAVLNELSKNEIFKPLLHSVNFAKRIVSKMPNIPVINDTEIERLILPLPLNTFYVKQLVTNCRLTTLMPYLPIHFNLASLESRKTKIAKILHYCKVANPANMSTQQALINAEELLKSSPDFDVTSEHVEVLIKTIPCARFTLIKPLLRFMSVTNIVSLLPWDLDVYRKSRTFKLRILDLLAALRNVKELQSPEMFSALDYLEANVKLLPEQVTIPEDRVTDLINQTEAMSSEPCVSYRDFVSRTENLVQILPPNYRFQSNPETVHNEWASIIYMSSLFLRDVKMNGSMKSAFEACTNNIRKFDKNQFYEKMITELNSLPFEQFISLRLYILNHADSLIAPIEDIYRGFLRGTMYTLIRVTMKEFIHRPELIDSKSVIDDMEVFLHDYVMLKLQEDQPTLYDVDLAVSEIPNDRKYDDLKVFLRCQEVRTPVMERKLSADDSPKQLLLKLLKVAEEEDIDEEVRRSIETLKPDVERDLREEEVELVLKQLRDYRHHASKLEAVRRYLLRVGLQTVLMDDFRTAYPTYKQRLSMLNERLLNGVSGQPNDGEFQAELKYLNQTLHNEVKIVHLTPRTMDDIRVQSLFLALPRTKDERLIRGIIRFFSIPDLLRRLNLPRDPFEYLTKGRLLQAIMDLGQELESVQEDPVQQEALEFFRDKIVTEGGPGAQPIEFRKDARGSNVDVDTYGLMRAIDYTMVNESDAVELANFLDRKYDRLVYAVGFSHLTYPTRGLYLKALLEHLVNVSQVPDEEKELMKKVIPAVRLDGPGEEGVDLNLEVEVYQEAREMFGHAKLLAPRLGSMEIVSQDFQENRESLMTAVDQMLQTISSSEEEYLGKITGQGSSFMDKTRVFSKAPQHPHNFIPRRKNFNSSRFEEDSSPTKRRSLNEKKIKNKKKNNQSTGSLLDDIIFEIPVKHDNKPLKKGGLIKSKDSSIKSPKKTVESSLSEKLPKKSRNRKRHKSVSQRILPQPTSIDVDDRNGSEPITKMLRDMLLRDEKNLSLMKKLMEEQLSTGEKRRTVKKDLSKRKEEKEETKKHERHEAN